MASVARPLSPGIFAGDAQTTIPNNPVPGVSYRDPEEGTASIAQGWPFQRLVNSAEFNEVMYRITSLLEVVNKTAGLAWSDQVDYVGPSAVQAPSFVASTDGHLYVALQPSGPDSGGARDPALGNTCYWSQFSGLSAGANVGDVKAVATEQPPIGWLKCNGAVVSRTQYAALFEAIGTRFGAGNGSTTFGLPDLRGEFVRGWDDGRGVDSDRALGSGQADQNAQHNHAATVSSAGEHTHTLSASIAPSGAHTHAVSGTAASAGTHTHGMIGRANQNAAGTAPQPSIGAVVGDFSNAIQSSGTHTHTVSGTTTSEGVHTHTVSATAALGGAHMHSVTVSDSGGNEARSRNIALLYVIKY